MQRASPDQHLNPWTFRGDFVKSTRAIRSSMAAARKPFLEIRFTIVPILLPEPTKGRQEPERVGFAGSDALEGRRIASHKFLPRAGRIGSAPAVLVRL